MNLQYNVVEFVVECSRFKQEALTWTVVVKANTVALALEELTKHLVNFENQRREGAFALYNEMPPENLEQYKIVSMVSQPKVM